MSRLPVRKLRGFYSSLSMVAIFSVGYPFNPDIESVLAGDASAEIENRPSVVEIKSPSDAEDVPAAKRIIEETIPPSSFENLSAPPDFDLNKGLPTPDKGEPGGKSPLLEFQATAYSLKGRTASGVYTRPGIIAADPRVLPLGTVVQVQAGKYSGIYTVLDTGAKIKGRIIDIYITTYGEARQFGRRRVKLRVIKPARKGPGKARPTRKASQSTVGASSNAVSMEARREVAAEK